MLNQIVKSLIIFSFLSLLPQLIFAQTPTILELNKPIEREIKVGQPDTFQIILTANQFARITIEQKGVDVGGKLSDSDGNAILQADIIKTLLGTETLEVVANKSGTYTLQITVRDLRKDGKYEILLAELHDATEKEKALDDARKLLFQANQLWSKRKCDEAIPIVNKGIEIFERELGKSDKMVGKALLTLGNQYYCKGEYNKAEPIYLRSLKIYEDILGKDDVESTLIMQELGSNYRVLGNYLKAEEIYRRILEIREKKLDPNHGFIADTLTNLANLSVDRGDLEKAKTYNTKALQIRENIFGPEHQFVAESLVNLANTSHDIAFSEPLYLRALAIREKLFGKESVQVGRVLYSLSTLYIRNNDFVKAESSCKTSLAIFEKTVGVSHPMTSYSINLLAIIYTKSGKYAEAESILKKAIEIKEKSYNVFHPEIAGTLSNLTGVYALNGEVEKAVDVQKRANEIVELNISANLNTGSEREKLLYLQTFDDVYQQSMTLHFQYAQSLQSATDIAAQLVLQQKGRVLDVSFDQINVLRNRFDEKDRLLLDTLNELNKQISEFITSTNNESSIAYKAKIQSLTENREKLEGEISRRASRFFEKSKPIELAEVQSQIPNSTVLLEFATYIPVDFKDPENESAKNTMNQRYAVFIVQNNGEVKSKDLGETKPIDEAISKFRDALQDPKRTDIKQLSQAVNEKVIAPIREFLGDSKQLLISPDGQLNLIPFEALADKDGKYLVEKYSISYLSSGRDLLRMQNSKPNNNPPLIIANPAFGESQNAVAINSQVAKRNVKRGVNVAKSLSETYFSPLSGTEQEGKAIQTLFPESTLLDGEKATENALKQTKSPRILHIATHGFFIEDEKSDSENPLLRSGLAFTGANVRTDKDNDGILTALEGSGLNLFGTKLVVLSACGTGLGEVRTGEGVFGLRRSFVLAGSESLVISLWSVSDYITRELMTNYYKNLKQGVGRGESLRKVQLDFLKNPKRQHPFYWASFIQSGDWRGL